MSRSDIPEWVRLACGRWGRQKRRIWSGHDWYGNIDGYAQSLLGRIRDEREGAGQGTTSQRWPEVFFGDGLDVQRVMLGMSERPFAALHFQYVWNPDWNVTVPRKAGYLGIKRTEYFALVEQGETWIHARLQSDNVPDSQLVEQVHEIVREALSPHSASAIKRQTSHTCQRAELNLSALNRPKLSLSR